MKEEAAPMHELDIFSVALEMERPNEQSDYLDRACGDDVGLRRRIEALLRSYAGAGSFMALPACGPCAIGDDEEAGADAAQLPEQPGMVIGPYKLLQQIGEGGMGTVFMAEQTQPVQRKVALKIIKPGMDSLQVITRFEAERQALALMDHPNIARVLDAGTISDCRMQNGDFKSEFENLQSTISAGRPYFVMELVKGVPITRYCDEHQLTPRECLELFIPVCQAVQHAHQKGIIHRDLKPSNVLVAEYDDRPVVKVIDFGVAKATGPRLTERTMFTEFGQVVGTLEYMSPEQAKLNALDIDTRSDIYALGVLLYELLTGTTPLERTRAQEAGLLESLRIIREEETQCPSARLSTSQEPSIVAKRGLEPKHLSGLVRGELDWIVMRALEKDRDRRYETANGLALDLQRYLADEPVLACPPSRWYRLRKMARRNKPALTTAALVAAALVLTVLVLAISNASVTREKEVKEQALEAAEANLLLARQAVDEMYTQVADELAGQPQMHPFQRELLRKAARFYQEFARRKSSDPLIRLESAHASLQVAKIDWTLGQRRQTEAACRAAIAELEDLAPALPAQPRLPLVLGEAHYFLAQVLAESGRRQQAEHAVREAIAQHEPLAGSHPTIPDYQTRLVGSYNFLGGLLHHRPREAERCHRHAIALCEQLVAGWPREVGHVQALASSHYALGVLLAQTGDPQQTEQALRRAIELASRVQSAALPQYASFGAAAHHVLGKLLAAGGQADRAEAAYRHAVILAEKPVLLFPDVPGYRQALVNYAAVLARFLEDNGRPEEAAVFKHLACDHLAKLVADFPDGIGGSAQSATAWQGTLALLQRDLGDLPAAERLYRKALTAAKQLASENAAEPSARERLAKAHWGLAIILQKAKRPSEAADEFRAEHAIWEELAAEFPGEPEYRYRCANNQNFLGIALRTQPGQAETAAQLHRQSIALCDRLTAEFPDQPLYKLELVRSHYALGIALEIAERCPEAEESLLQALALLRPEIDRALSDGYTTQLASIHNDLAWLRATRPDEEHRDVAKALESARKAVALDPNKGNYWNTLGVVHYRARQWKEAIGALNKSMKLRRGGDSSDWFFQAMAHAQLGERDEAERWHRRAIEWMDQHRAADAELLRFRAEAAQVLGAQQQTP
jgi:serine/threonine protein kinase